MLHVRKAFVHKVKHCARYFKGSLMLNIVLFILMCKLKHCLGYFKV